MLLVIHQYARVCRDIPVTHLQNVILNVRFLSSTFKSKLFVITFSFYAVTFATLNTPCSPSPCGANAVCKESNGAGSCTCLPDYVGNPYDGCRPECTKGSDCLANLACIRNKCKDPCPGICGPNAICQVVDHIPSCSCLPKYTGDPFSYCRESILGTCKFS